VSHVYVFGIGGRVRSRPHLGDRSAIGCGDLIDPEDFSRRDGRDVVYIEHVNEKGRVDDFFLRDEDGNDMGDEAAGIVDDIDAAIEALPKEQ
jgi:hypothetical protein